MIKVIQRNSISSQLYNILLQEIINRELAPGDRLIEREICERLGVSRTPLRDAINLLAKDGFVSVEDKKGATVKEYNIEDVIEVYDIRAVLESKAVILATHNISANELAKFKIIFETSDPAGLQKADKDFHELFINSCGNKRLKSILMNLGNMVEMFRASGYLSRKRLKSASNWHLKIIDALQGNKPELAAKYMAKHIEQTKNEILAEVQTHNPQGAGYVASDCSHRTEIAGAQL